MGPLQPQVQEFDFSDWQNIDWIALSDQNYTPGGLGLGGVSLGEDDAVYDMDVSYVGSYEVFFPSFVCVFGDDDSVLMTVC